MKKELPPPTYRMQSHKVADLIKIFGPAIFAKKQGK